VEYEFDPVPVVGSEELDRVELESSALSTLAHEVDGEELAQDEIARDETEFDIDGSLLDTIERELADVERALALLDEGGYGQCEHCSAVIDDEVLARTPTARFCSEHLPLTLR
jgi:RNA polymerase-binding transcription factor DksA